jgi:hypothetical protein
MTWPSGAARRLSRRDVENSMRKALATIAAAGMAASACATPASAEIIKTEAELAGKNFCWSSGYDSEQYGRDYSYAYSFHSLANVNIQFVIHGAWSIARDGTVTLKIDGGGTLIRRYDIDGDRVNEVTGSLGSLRGGGFVC